MLATLVCERSVVGAPGWFLAGTCRVVVLPGSGQGAVWTTKSQGFPPLGESFANVFCFCHAGKLCYTEDRIGLNEEGWH